MIGQDFFSILAFLFLKILYNDTNILVLYSRIFILLI